MIMSESGWPPGKVDIQLQFKKIANFVSLVSVSCQFKTSLPNEIIPTLKETFVAL